MTRLLGVVLVSLVLAGPSQAQEPIRWDSLGYGVFNDGFVTDSPMSDILVRPGIAGDTVLFNAGGRIFQMLPGETMMREIYRSAFVGDLLEQATSGMLVSGDFNDDGVRSFDGGRTWTQMVYPRTDFKGLACIRPTTHPRFDGAVLGCQSIGGLLLTDDAFDWQLLVGLEAPTRPEDVIDIPEGPHAGRLALRLQGGTHLISDDGGETWTTTATQVTGGQLVWSPSGTLFSVRGPSVSASTDGGERWEVDRYRFASREFVPTPNKSRLVAGDDGVLWLALSDRGTDLPLPNRGVGAILRSGDDGRSWTDVSGDYGGYEILEVARDRAGRLILATGGGVWRSQEGVVTVTSEEPPPGKPSEAALLDAPYPNPTGDQITVPLVLREAAEVRVAVVDLLGREVAVLTEGRRAAGTHALAFDTGGLPAGVYVVRATVGGVVATQRVTVAR